MNLKHYVLQTVFLLLVGSVHGQGTLIVDQQATNYVEANEGSLSQPLGQSFTPALSSVGFVTLFIDVDPSAEATIYVNLRSTSITGTILGSTTPVFFPNSFGDYDYPIFYFPTAISVTPGVQYFLQPIVQSGDTFGIFDFYGSYVGGNLIAGGVVIPNHELWFQEGIVAAPEPSSAWLAILGGGVLFYARRRK